MASGFTLEANTLFSLQLPAGESEPKAGFVRNRMGQKNQELLQGGVKVFGA